MCPIGVFQILPQSLNTASWLYPRSKRPEDVFLRAGTPVKVFEAGIKERSIVIEFDSPAKAIEAYESPAYQSALKIFDGAAERDIRILEGVS